MPFSETVLRPWVLMRLAYRCGLGSIRSVVDVGAGGGTARDYYGPHMPAARWTAIEIWEPYVERFGLDTRYDTVIVGDAREIELPAADLYLFGDVLEHMSQFDAVKLWDRAREVASWLVIGLPVLCYPQGEVDGNPYEAHLHQWDTAGVLASFTGITDHHDVVPGSTVGAFIARGC